MTPDAGIASDQNWHSLEPAQALDHLRSSAELGLSDHEVQSRLGIYGHNVIKAQRGTSPLKILLKQFYNLLIGILLIATLISAVLGEVVDAVVIFAIVIVAVLLGFFQEFRAEKALESLKKMLSPTCNVIRGGLRKEIPAEDLVPGDILLLEAGERVDADGRLIEAFNLHVDEAPLTGESAPVVKTVTKVDAGLPIADRISMAYTGTTIIQGRGKALVVSTGMHTEFGKIASEVAAIETEETPLERQGLGKRMHESPSVLACPLCRCYCPDRAGINA